MILYIMPDGENPNRAKHPWEQLPRESDTWYRAFLVYRNLGPQRTREDAYSIWSGRTTRPSGQFTESARLNGWVARAKAFDLWEQQQQDNARLQGKVEAARAQGVKLAEEEWAERRTSARQQGWELSQALVKKAKEMLGVAIINQKIVPASETSPEIRIFNPARWSFATLCQMVETADTLMRLSTQLPVTQADVNGLGNQNPDESDMFARTAGELEAVLPAGVVPEMPIDVETSPPVSIARESAARGLNQPTRQRPRPRGFQPRG